MCLWCLESTSHYGSSDLLILKSTASHNISQTKKYKIMKHFITIISIIILSTISINTYAQLNAVTHEEAYGYKTVWKAPMRYGCIRYSDGFYYLCGSTNNKYEKSYATILLGDDKESAILSLDDLYKIVSKETKLPKGGLIVKSIDNKTTTIYKTINCPHFNICSIRIMLIVRT